VTGRIPAAVGERVGQAEA